MNVLASFGTIQRFGQHFRRVYLAAVPPKQWPEFCFHKDSAEGVSIPLVMSSSLTELERLLKHTSFYCKFFLSLFFRSIIRTLNAIF